ncbi:hypothetical protein [Vulcanisaeta thermophila]|uniref:hypothetical protein n=1 Tax=Vulcanisaeta thermophila TaxID=867917 RepID=UPI000852B4C0|nr:hypothetical protein [Vulcanisaeta thermophila]
MIYLTAIKSLVIIRYILIGQLIRAFLMALPIEVVINMVKSLRRGDRARAVLVVKMMKYLVLNIRREVGKRGLYGYVREGFYINIPNSLVKEYLIEYLALRKALLGRL